MLIRLVRGRAAEWRVNPAQIGIMGFSAGGEVAALAATRFDAGKTERPTKSIGLARGRISTS